MNVTITNAGGRIEIVDLRNDLRNNYNVLKDGLRLFNLGDIVRITFINQTNIEINYDEVELINGATSVFPVSGTDFLDELNVILGDYGTGGDGATSLEDLTDVQITTVANGEVLIYDSALGKWVNTSAPGGGDMFKSVYDTDNDGVVDKAETVQIIVRNSTGVTLTKGQIVYLSGATGNRPNAVLSQANSEATSSKTIGWVYANIPNNSDGYVCVSGSQHDLDTSAYSAGNALWLSPSVAGGMTATVPTQPDHAVFIGYCARSHPTQGRIVFKIQNGYELHELHNVLITSVANNEGLFYESSTSLWKNKTIATALGFTPVTDVRTISTSSPLSGGGDLTANRTLAIADAAADGSTKGAATFTANDFNASSGLISIDYTNGQAASTSAKGFLTSADFTTFNAKQSAITLTTLGTSGAATFAANTLNIPQYASAGAGALYKSTVDTAGFLSTSNTAVYTQLIPANTYGIGDILRVTYRTRKTGTAGIQIMRIYVNTTADLSGSPIFVGQYRGIAANTILQMIRHLAIKSSTANTEVLSSATTGQPTDFAQDVPSTLVIDWTAAKYFVFAIQNASAADTNYGSMFLIEKL